MVGTVEVDRVAREKAEEEPRELKEEIKRLKGLMGLERI